MRIRPEWPQADVPVGLVFVVHQRDELLGQPVAVLLQHPSVSGRPSVSRRPLEADLDGDGVAILPTFPPRWRCRSPCGGKRSRERRDRPVWPSSVRRTTVRPQPARRGPHPTTNSPGEVLTIGHPAPPTLEPRTWRDNQASSTPTTQIIPPERSPNSSRDQLSELVVRTCFGSPPWALRSAANFVTVSASWPSVAKHTRPASRSANRLM